MKKKHTTNSSSTARWRNLLFALVGLCWLAMQLMANATVHQDVGQDATPTTPTSIDFATSSAGCLLVMDDNPRLVEWLAYHHYALNLRYLIVAVDPRSTTSPTSILDRWKPYGLQYELWTDDDYMGSRVWDKRQRLTELKRKQLTMVHRVRQKAFYQFCLEHLDGMNAGWTLMIDVDEYYTIRQDKVNDPGILSRPGGLYEFIQQTSQQADNKQFQSPCVSIPRLLFGAEEHSTSLMIQKNLHQANIYLDTTRWFYHAYFSELDRNGLAKTLVDLHRITLPKPHFPHPVNPHRPFADLCRDPKKIYDIHQDALLRVHHYLSTWETYSYRNDSRKGGERSREAWEFRAYGGQVGPTRDIVPWIDGFVQYHGRDQAVQLSQGAGVPPSFTRSSSMEEEWKFQFVQDFLDPDNPQHDSNYGRFLQNRTAKVDGGTAD